MILKQLIDVSIDPQSIVENQHNEDILEFVLKINELLENQDFTLQLIIHLLESIDCPKNILSKIQDHYGTWVVD